MSIILIIFINDIFCLYMSTEGGFNFIYPPFCMNAKWNKCIFKENMPISVSYIQGHQ